MNVRRSAALLLWPFPMMATALMLSSCTHPAMRSTQASSLQVSAPQIAQMGYGAQADFIQCVPPQCPVRTPKTLGAPWMPEAPVTPAPEAAPSAASVPLPEATPEPNPQGSHANAPEQLTWSVPFAFGSAQLGAQAQSVLRQVIDELPPSSRITIAGRTDSSGPAGVNDALARARADAVRKHLLHARPDLAGAITLDAQGDCCFAASNDTATGRARNRRVEILAEPPAPPP